MPPRLPTVMLPPVTLPCTRIRPPAIASRAPSDWVIVPPGATTSSASPGPRGSTRMNQPLCRVQSACTSMRPVLNTAATRLFAASNADVRLAISCPPLPTTTLPVLTNRASSDARYRPPFSAKLPLLDTTSKLRCVLPRCSSKWPTLSSRPRLLP